MQLMSYYYYYYYYKYTMQRLFFTHCMIDYTNL